MTATIPETHPHRPMEVLRQADDDGRAVRRQLSAEDCTRFEGYAGETVSALYQLGAMILNGGRPVEPGGQCITNVDVLSPEAMRSNAGREAV